MVGKQKPKLPEQGLAIPKAKKVVNILGESDDENEVEAEPSVPPDPTDPVSASLVKLTSIVEVLAEQKNKKKGLKQLLESLDDSNLHQDLSSSSSSSSSRRHPGVVATLKKALKEGPNELFLLMQERMLVDFGVPENAPGTGLISPTFPSWLEHRSRIPNLASTVRMAWAIAGALDLMQQDWWAEARCRLLLTLGQLDQVASSRGIPRRATSLYFIQSPCLARCRREPGYQTLAGHLGRQTPSCIV